LDQNTTSRSVNPQSAITARCIRASASARKVFWMMLGCCGGGFGAFGCIVSGGAAAAAAALLSADCIAGSLAGSLTGSLGEMSLAILLSDRLRRCGGFASGAGCGGVSVAAPAPDFAAASRAC
jgi:hypothetical protein